MDMIVEEDNQPKSILFDPANMTDEGLLVNRITVPSTDHALYLVVTPQDMDKTYTGKGILRQSKAKWKNLRSSIPSISVYITKVMEGKPLNISESDLTYQIPHEVGDVLGS